MLKWWYNWRIKIHQYILKKKLDKLQVTRQSKSFDEARHIGILFDASRSETHQIIKNYQNQLRRRGKKVQLLAYFNDRRKDRVLTFDYFTRREVNFFWQPKSPKVDQFIEQPFDILISLHLNSVPPLEYIATLSKARLRVGPYRYNKEYCYDLMIDTATNKNLQNFLHQTNHFLNVINRPQTTLS